MQEEPETGRTEPQAELHPPKRPGSARRMFLSTVLFSEALVVLFATLAAHGLQVADRPAVWGIGGGAMVLCVIAAVLLRRAPVPAIVIGSAIQLLLLASAVVLPAMAVVGAVFAVLWIVSLRVGGRIDVERGERYEAELAYYAERAGRP